MDEFIDKTVYEKFKKNIYIKVKKNYVHDVYCQYCKCKMISSSVCFHRRSPKHKNNVEISKKDYKKDIVKYKNIL